MSWQITQSKKGGILLFSGGFQFELSSVATAAKLFIELRSENRMCIVDESRGYGFFYDSQDSGQWNCKTFTVPYLSDQMIELVSQILKSEACKLPTYEESIQCHLPLINKLIAFISLVSKKNIDECLIT
jgi:hypothetical protein